MSQDPENPGNKEPEHQDPANKGPLNHAALVEFSMASFRDNRADAARWLAVEVLLSDEAALEDDELVNLLCSLQDRLEAQTRQRLGIA